MRTRYWPKRMAMSVIAIGSALFVGCTDKPGSAGWCEQRSGKTKSEWSCEDAKKLCLALRVREHHDW